MILKNCFTCEHIEIIENNFFAKNGNNCVKRQIKAKNLEESEEITMQLNDEHYLKDYKRCYEPKQT